MQSLTGQTPDKFAVMIMAAIAKVYTGEVVEAGKMAGELLFGLSLPPYSQAAAGLHTVPPSCPMSTIFLIFFSSSGCAAGKRRPGPTTAGGYSRRSAASQVAARRTCWQLQTQAIVHQMIDSKRTAAPRINLLFRLAFHNQRCRCNILRIVNQRQQEQQTVL